MQLPSKVGENTWNTGVMQVEVGKIYQKTGKSTSFWWFHTVYSAIGRQTQCNCLQIHAFPANIREQGNTRQMQAIRSSFKIYLISGKSTKNLPDFGNLRHFTVQLPTKHWEIGQFTGNIGPNAGNTQKSPCFWEISTIFYQFLSICRAVTVQKTGKHLKIWTNPTPIRT